MSLRHMTGETRLQEERRQCPRCDSYRGYVCAEHRNPSYETLAAENARLNTLNAIMLTLLESLKTEADKAVSPQARQYKYTDIVQMIEAAKQERS
jgi:hypothetical protein